MMGTMKDGRPRSLTAIITMVVLALLWTVPTMGLLVTSFRSREDVAATGWWEALANPFDTAWTLANYQGAIANTSLGTSLLNSVVVAVPATVLPIMFAAFAAYAFTFMKFPGKELLFIAIVAVMVVPIQVAFQ
ncbi:MAG: carbohydrate ABC transporter permease, partial [Actinomycetales bacterium]|nr:carbohydrate ABC transporter permease [Actinomycetales bacterium]